MKKFKSVFQRVVSMTIALAVVASLFCIPQAFAAREYSASVYILGSKVGFVNEPYESSGVIYVPLEEICGYLNLKCEKQSSGDEFIITRGKNSVLLQNGNMICKLNEEAVTLSGQPRTKNDTVYIPVDMLDKCFSMPLKLDMETHYAEITPNVYKVYINEQNAAAVDLTSPNSDVLNKGTAEQDSLYTYEPKAQESDMSVFYKFDLSEFAGRKIKTANLVVTLGIYSNYYSHLEICRTKNWDKRTINYNNQPEVIDDVYIKDKILDDTTYKQNINSKNSFFPSSLPLTNWAVSSIEQNEPLSIKMLGIPYANNKNPVSPQILVKGVNTPEKAYIEITLDEQYNFPVAKEERKSEVDRNTFDAMSLLKKLGIIKEGEEFPADLSEGITRGEFINYAVRLYGDSASYGTGEEIFSDVLKNSTYFESVGTAAVRGIISAEPGSTFRPDDGITYNEAITIVCRILGYDVYANSNGGYPGGYISAAQSGGLLKGIGVSEAFGFDKIFKLFFNALGAPNMEATGYDANDPVGYEFDEDSTLLSKFFKAYKIKGRVNGNEYTNIDSAKAGTSDRLYIDDKEVYIDNPEYNSLLGYYVTAYCTDEEDEALYIGVNENKDDTETIDLSDVIEVKNGTSAVELSYENNNGKIVNESVEKTDWVIYNGKTVSTDKINEKLFEAETGSVVFLNDDTVIITAYTTIVVNSVDIDNEIIVDEYDAYDKVIRLENVDYYAFKNESGDIVPLEGIKKSDVISAAISLDKKLVCGELSRRALTAKLQEISGKETLDFVITLNGNEFKAINQYKSWTDLLSLGAEGDFLLDSFGNVVGFVSIESKDNFGYLLGMSAKEGIDGAIEVAIITVDSEKYMIYQLADNVNIDGESYKDSSLILQYFTDAATDKVKKQGIVFNVNSDKKINKIDTAAVGENEVQENTLCLAYTASQPQLRYKGIGRLGDLFYWDLKSSLNVWEPKDEDDITSYLSIQTGVENDKMVYADIYTIGNIKPVADMVVLKNYGLSDAVSASDYLAVVSKTTTALNKEGEMEKRLYAYVASTDIASVNVPADKFTLLDGINTGDLIRFGSNYKGEITAISKYYDYATKKIVNNPNYDLGSFNAETRVYGGYIYDTYNDYIKFTNDLDNKSTDNYRWYSLKDNSKIFKYKVSGSGVVISTASIGDISTFKHVPYAPSGVMLQVTYGQTARAGYIIELGKPANTGIYKVTFSGGDGGNGTPPELIRADAGDTITLPANTFVRPEYDFEGWTTDNDANVYLPGDSVTIAGDTEFSAEWTYVGKQYSITFVGGEGATGNATTLTSSSGKIVKLPANPFTKPGYIFVAWTDGNYEYQPGDDYTVPEADVEFSAVWVKCWDGSVAAEAPSTTTIGEASYYQISDGTELAWFASQVNAGSTAINAILTDDIYLNYGGTYTNNWYNHEIGTSANKFAGIFDGAGHSINGMYVTANSTATGGLFKYISGGTVKDVVMKDVNIVSTYGNQYSTYTGAIAADCSGGTITGCSVSGSISHADGKHVNGVGGIAAFITDSTVSDCYSDINITANGSPPITDSGDNYYIGGIVGRAVGSSTIERCGNAGTIYAPNYFDVAGVVGWVSDANVTVKECYNTGNITGKSYVAGIAVIKYYQYPTMGSLYNTGAIKATMTRAAGLVAGSSCNGGSIARGSYTTGNVSCDTADDTTSGLAYSLTGAQASYFPNFIYPELDSDITWPVGSSSSVLIGEKKTLEEIKTQETVDMLNGWAGEGTYKIDSSINAGYPVFTWQN